MKTTKSNKVLLKQQALIEEIIKRKNLTEIVKCLIYLLRKFLPKDFSYKADQGKQLYFKFYRKFNIFKNS